MKIIQLSTNIYDKIMEEARLANAERYEAEKEYNIMMGTYIDPAPQEDEENEENEEPSDE